jgi:subtilisin-like proprotein convertase family protein
VTSDLLGSNGLNTAGDCTAYAGTSAACPQAAGIVALVLEANPNLGWLEVQYVLANATNRSNSDPADTLWRQNGAGKWVSEYYGFGLLDADAAVTAAENWGDRKLIEIPYNKSFEYALAGTSAMISFDETVDISIHHVEVHLWTKHKDVHATTITLESPQGTVSTLATPHNDYLSAWDGWRFLSRMHHGENLNGAWTLSVNVKDETEQQQSLITSWTITVYGIAIEGQPQQQPYQQPSPPDLADNSNPHLPNPFQPQLTTDKPPGPIGSGHAQSQGDFDLGQLDTAIYVAAIVIGIVICIGYFGLKRCFSRK